MMVITDWLRSWSVQACWW